MCGGRLKNVPVEVSVAKKPTILPKHHHVVELIVKHCHGMSGHSRQEYVLSSVRQKFYLIKGRTTVRKLLKNSFKCKRLWKPSSEQKMADLPEDRITPRNPPFSCWSELFWAIYGETESINCQEVWSFVHMFVDLCSPYQSGAYLGY